ncbi:hypothetical protein, partial [uncultured Gammaproteobacteria bacterium]
MGLDVVYVSGSKIPLNNYHILEYDRCQVSPRYSLLSKTTLRNISGFLIN